MTTLIKRYSTTEKWLAECSRRKKKNKSNPKTVSEGVGSKTVLRKNQINLSQRSVKIKWELLYYFEPVCPECNAKQGPFNLEDANLISEIKCYSCGLILKMVKKL